MKMKEWKRLVLIIAMVIVIVQLFTACNIGRDETSDFQQALEESESGEEFTTRDSQSQGNKNDSSETVEIIETTNLESIIDSEVTDSDLIDNEFSADGISLSVTQVRKIKNDMYIQHISPDGTSFVREVTGTENPDYYGILNDIYDENEQLIDVVDATSGDRHDKYKRVHWISDERLLIGGTRIYDFEFSELVDLVAGTDLDTYIDSYDINDSNTLICYVADYKVFLYNLTDNELDMIDGIELNDEKHYSYEIAWINDKQFLFENNEENINNLYVHDLETNETSLYMSDSMIIQYEGIEDIFIQESNDDKYITIDGRSTAYRFNSIMYSDEHDLYIAFVREESQDFILMILDSNFEKISSFEISGAIDQTLKINKLKREGNKIVFDCIRHGIDENRVSSYTGKTYEILLERE